MTEFPWPLDLTIKFNEINSETVSFLAGNGHLVKIV